jgi:cell division topological specificity factor
MMINWFKKIWGAEAPKKSAQTARERLMVIVSHERGQHDHQPDFLPMLQKELTDVIAKYVKIDKNMVHVDFEQKGGRSVLELNITLPEDAASMAGPSKPVVPSAIKPTLSAQGNTPRPQRICSCKKTPCVCRAPLKKRPAEPIKKRT